jgi:uncharacterized membrane protein YkoI
MTILQLTIAACLVAMPLSLNAQQITTDLPDSLAAKAKVSEPVARAKAKARVPLGTPTAVELERENGHLQYSYDLTVPGRKDITEVNVDAITGAVLSVHHETPDADTKPTPPA